MINILIVGIGGFFGSVSRYLISQGIMRLTDNPEFPAGTITVNIIGCLIMGAVIGYSSHKGTLSEGFLLLITVGFLGGYTIFSTFGLDGYKLLLSGKFIKSFLYISISVFSGLGSVWAGFNISKYIA